MSNPNQNTSQNEGAAAPPAAPFDPAQALLNQLSQAHAQAGQASAQSQLLHPYLQALNWGAAASNPLTLMLAQQQQMQLLQQQAALGLFLPSPTHSAAAAQLAALGVQSSPERAQGKADASNNNEAAGNSGELSTLAKNSNWCIPLGLEEDKLHLSELQCILRGEFVECFVAGKRELTASSHGRVRPITLGQVGLRCKHCKHLPMSNRVPYSYTYPSQLESIYSSVRNMHRVHFDQCKSIPSELKAKVGSLEEDNSNRSGKKQYWIDSAKRIGLVNASNDMDGYGIRFDRDPHSPLPPQGVRKTSSLDEDNVSQEPSDDESPVKMDCVQDVQEPEHYPLVLPEDKPLISDYLYLALEQMTPTNLQAYDRVGCYKGRRTGFPGLACKHCVGQAGCGRYFPASEASLSQTTTSQTLVNHVRNCRRCPIEVREELELMKRAKHNHDSKNHDNKPRHGGRKAFFHRLWCRIQRIPLPKHEKIEDSPHSKTSNRERSLSSPSSSGKKRKKSADMDNDDFVRKSKSRDDDDRDFDIDSLSADGSMKDYISTAFQGSVRLTKDDDPHWLSDACCFIRKELVEVFTAEEEDLEEENCSFLGQVGVRCVYCAQKPIKHRPKGHVCFPASVAGVQDAVEAVRRHLQLCTEIPADIRATYRSMKGYESKLDADTTQYWVDSAKELGLSDYDGGSGEVMFFRNPYDPSPADENDVERENNMPTGSFVVRAEDRATCTDHIILLLKQFKPCRFGLSDRKGGIAKSRDRPLNFPGLQCIHCKHKRYFPIGEKKVSDTTNLMMTHLTNCFGVPLEIKASLCYLQHRSLIQKAELMGNWKITFFKRVWDRLHRQDWGDGSSYIIPEITEQSAHPIAAAQSTENNEEDGPDIEVEESFEDGETDPNHADEMEKMRPLIRAAALWLSEQDANAEARVRSGRGIGTIQTVRARSGRGRGGSKGRGIRRRLSS